LVGAAFPDAGGALDNTQRRDAFFTGMGQTEEAWLATSINTMRQD